MTQVKCDNCGKAVCRHTLEDFEACEATLKTQRDATKADTNDIAIVEGDFDLTEDLKIAGMEV